MARLRILLLLCLVMLSVVSTASAQVTRGPFLQQVMENSALVVCEGALSPPPEVFLTAADGGQYVASCQCISSHCLCPLAGLTPSTGYAYGLRQDGVNLGEGQFVTAPVGPESFQFAVHGDNRSDHVAHATVVENLLGENLAFVVNTGDMVSDGEVEEQWDEFFAIEGELLASVPIYPAVGNHEEHDGEIAIYERTFELPAQACGSGEESYYSFDYANAHFVVIDDFVQVHPWYECLLIGKLYDNCLTNDQLSWLNIDLAQAAADPTIDHVFVIVHEGPYSSKQGRTGSAAVRDLLPLFAKSKVKVIFGGHDHYFEHGVTGNGIDYVISGGGGAPLYDIAPGVLSQIAPHDVLVNKSTHNYQVVTVTGPHINVVTRDVDELALLDEFDVGSPPSCVVAPDCDGEQEGTCPGTFECIDFVCVWVCDAPPPCETEADCPEPPEGVCPGHWQCSLAHTCQWLCDPAPECTIGADCLAKEPFNQCPAGIWQCVDEVCEWYCPPPVGPGPDVVSSPDGVVLDGAGQEDQGTQEGPDGTAPEATVPDLATDSLPPVSKPPSAKSGGCSATPPAGQPPATGWFLCLFLAALLWRAGRAGPARTKSLFP